MKTVAVVCDFCGVDLSTPTPRPGYYITVSEASRRTGGYVFSVHVEPELSGDLHFCDMSHLRMWADGRVKREALE